MAITRPGQKLKRPKKPKSEGESQLSYWLHKASIRSIDPRPLTRIHASDVTKPEWCGRRHALAQLTGKTGRKEFIGTATSLVFHQGHELATYVIEKAVEAGIAYGGWVCVPCGERLNFGPKPERCGACGLSLVRYEEERFRSEICGIGGGLDLLVSLPGFRKLVLVELKTIGKEEFKKLAMPLAEHHDRTNLYLRLVKESRHPQAKNIDHTQARVLYISKGGYGERSSKPKEWGLKDQSYTPFKEFVVKADPESSQVYSDMARPLFLWQLGKAGLPDGICETAVCSRAQRCDMFNECFGGQYKAGTHKQKEPLV